MQSKFLMPLFAIVVIGAVGCGDDDENGNGNVNVAQFDTIAKIEAFLDGKTLTMEGNNIPSDPNGFNQNVNFGQATQCYNSTVVTITGAQWTTTSVLGTLNNAPNVGDVGTCDNDTPFGPPLEFVSTGVAISNVQGDGECFDINATYAGFKQEGRGQIVNEGAEVHLEFYFVNQATGIRCADGAVGSTGVTLNMAAFTGDSVQRYVVSE